MLMPLLWGDHFTVSNKEKSHTIVELWDYYQLMLLLNTLHALLDVQYAMSQKGRHTHQVCFVSTIVSCYCTLVWAVWPVVGLCCAMLVL